MVEPVDAMSADTRSPDTPSQYRDVDGALWMGPDIEEAARGVRAHERALSAREHRRAGAHPWRLDGGAPSEHRRMQAVQQTAVDAVLDRASAQPKDSELRPRDQQVLFGRHQPDEAIDMNE